MALLVCESVTMRFGGLTAVNEVSLAVEPGAIVAIIGPNGAGKSTLFNVVTGIYRPTEGRVLFAGEDITGLPAHRTVARGIARTFQTSRLFGELSVLDNVMLGMHTQSRTSVIDALFLAHRARAELERCAARAGELLREVSRDLWEQRLRPAAELAQADRRRLEIARALAARPKLLLLDEPSSGMDDRETDALVEDIRRIRAERPDLAVVLIEHDMRLVAALPEHVVVLDYGNKIAEGTFAEVRRDRRVQEAYLGRAHADA
ncbi:MAG TPA: ABC transporter ATP-binding protein [Beijerinckiaceae bacterium]|nr:ABC transporter ATP-binding protein [Beijerinckiaceae bacterium]